MCQSGIDYRGLALAIKQLSKRKVNLREDLEAWADYFLEQGDANTASGFKDVVSALGEAEKGLSEINARLEQLEAHEHHHGQHISVTQFSEEEA